jgi:hypothetical protein
MSDMECAKTQALSSRAMEELGSIGSKRARTVGTGLSDVGGDCRCETRLWTLKFCKIVRDEETDGLSAAGTNA